jgi:tRNA nucleotidyltransferase (CCA-adding enzyme)
MAEGAAFGLKDLAIDGGVLMRELGIAPGRQIGEILRELLEEVVENPALNTRPKLLDRAKAIIAGKAT